MKKGKATFLSTLLVTQPILNQVTFINAAEDRGEVINQEASNEETEEVIIPKR